MNWVHILDLREREAGPTTDDKSAVFNIYSWAGVNKQAPG